MKTVSITITSAVVIGGEIVTAGRTVPVAKADAADLIRRGRAEPATSEDARAAEEDDSDDADGDEPDTAATRIVEPARRRRGR